MITNLLLLLIQGFIFVLLSPLLLFNDVPPGSTLTQTNNFIGVFYRLLPVTFTALFTAITLFLLFFAGLAAFRAIMWLIKKIPTIN